MNRDAIAVKTKYNKNFIRYIEMYYSEQQKERSMRREMEKRGLSFLLPKPVIPVRPKPRIVKWDDPEALKRAYRKERAKLESELQLFT